MEVSARRSATSPGRPLRAGGVYGRSSPVSLCSPLAPGALDSDVYWPAQLCLVRPQDLEPTTNGPPITRTVARFIQAPAQDPPACSAAVSVVYRRPIGAVVTVQRVRRRLQMSVCVYVRVVFVCPQYSPNKISPATAWLSLCSLLD